jgi:UDP-N-acetyl-D-glucosamine dehydrogenase
LLLGVAYKPNVSDTRESPAVDIWSMLEDWGARLSFHDPYVPTFAGTNSVELTTEELRDQDMVVIVTNHDSVDYDRIVEQARLVFDTRGVIRVDHEHVDQL